MTLNRLRTGRGVSRPAVTLAVAGLALVAGLVAVRGHGDIARGPVSVRNPEASPAHDSVVGSVRLVTQSAAPERLLIDTVPPRKERARLLFFQGEPAQPDGVGGAYTLDGTGGILRVDYRLNAQRIPVRVEGREIVSVAAAADGGLWLVSGEGEIIRTDPTGAMRAVTAGPFVYSLVASDAAGDAFLVRSPTQTAFRPVFGTTPLLARLADDGTTAATIGSGVVPADFLLTHFASSGRVAVTDSVIYYAPFIRDQVVALTASGDTLWVLRRELPQARDEPRFEVVDGDPSVDYAPVNLGIAMGPDHRLYVLSVPGFTTSIGRLDVIDPTTGHLIRSAETDVPLPTLAADESGRVYRIDEFALLTGVPADRRQPLAAFDLERLRGGRLSRDSLLGRVTLINFWASWCAPCREEMPALDALQQGIDDPDFRFLTMNEDVNPHNAMLFIREYGFEFPVLLGRGSLRAKYHYVGLPFTVLVDRQGNVVQRWIGYAGDNQIDALRSVILAELERGRVMDPSMMSGMDMSGFP